MKHLLLAIALTLVGCGGGSSTPTSIETVKEVFVPGDTVTVTEPGEVETMYVVQECPVCPEVVEDTVEIVTYWQLSSSTKDGVSTDDIIYNESGYILSNYNDLLKELKKYEYDSNNNQTSYIYERNGVVEDYTYKTYDSNSNLLTERRFNGRHTLYTYDENNHKTQSVIDFNGDGIYETTNYTYEGDNEIRVEYVKYNRIEDKAYDEHGNLIYIGVSVDDVLLEVKTFTYQEFTEEIK